MIEYGKNKFVAPDGYLQTYFDNIRRYYIKSYHVSVIEYKKSQIFTKGIHIILNDDINLEKWPHSNKLENNQDIKKQGKYSS